MKELEAKFLISAGKRPTRVLRRVLQELSWAGYLTHPRGTREIADVYSDSADWHLHKAGWTYRVRHSKGRQTVTLKQLSHQRSNIFERRELEQLLPPGEDDHALPPGDVAELLASTLPKGTPLCVLFEQRTARRRYNLSHPNHPHALIELSLDQVLVQSSPPTNYAEIEFELRDGPPEALKDLAGVMEQQPDLVPARVGKYQRGLLAAGLSVPESGVWQAAPKDVYAKWVEVAISHLSLQRARLKQHEPSAWEAVHPEGVHQMRVTTRRIRAGLAAFANVLPQKSAARLKDDVRWLTSALGPVRDLDVQLENLHNYRHLLTTAQGPALNRYQRHLEQRHRKAHRALVCELASDRIATLDAHFERVLEKASRRASQQRGISIQQAASDQVLPLLESVLKRGRAIKKSSPAEKLHKLRIELKRLRYQLEYLIDSCGKPARRSHKELSRLQNVLGSYQDAMVAMEQLEHYCHHTNLDRVERRTFNELMAWERERGERYRRKFPKRWARFENVAGSLLQVL